MPNRRKHEYSGDSDSSSFRVGCAEDKRYAKAGKQQNNNGQNILHF